MKLPAIHVYGSSACAVRTKAAVVLAMQAALGGRHVLLAERASASLQLMLPEPLIGDGDLFAASGVPDNRLVIATGSGKASAAQLSRIGRDRDLLIFSHGAVPPQAELDGQQHKVLVGGMDGLLLEQLVAVAGQIGSAAVTIAAVAPHKIKLYDNAFKRATGKFPALADSIRMQLLGYVAFTPPDDANRQLWQAAERILDKIKCPQPGRRAAAKPAPELGAARRTAGTGSAGKAPPVDLPEQDIAAAQIDADGDPQWIVGAHKPQPPEPAAAAAEQQPEDAESVARDASGQPAEKAPDPEPANAELDAKAAQLEAKAAKLEAKAKELEAQAKELEAKELEAQAKQPVVQADADGPPVPEAADKAERNPKRRQQKLRVQPPGMRKSDSTEMPMRRLVNLEEICKHLTLKGVEEFLEPNLQQQNYALPDYPCDELIPKFRALCTWYGKLSAKFRKKGGAMFAAVSAWQLAERAQAENNQTFMFITSKFASETCAAYPPSDERLLKLWLITAVRSAQFILGDDGSGHDKELTVMLTPLIDALNRHQSAFIDQQQYNLLLATLCYVAAKSEELGHKPDPSSIKALLEMYDNTRSKLPAGLAESITKEPEPTQNSGASQADTAKKADELRNNEPAKDAAGEAGKVGNMVAQAKEAFGPMTGGDKQSGNDKQNGNGGKQTA